ncbi:hypothetical protein [Sphingomonas sp.]|uniref:hypothetical protein n=1 Tax=Sphingomonas sp. TaxID=28214 RepID=UPI000DB79595|nr:hypothetical protein [Sphingomonas sp.]PZU06038.1 MAG: hypothetical protein DI605_20175 [Sphingomonas sp.]
MSRDPAEAHATAYGEASLETAACLWEAVLDLRDNPRSDPDSIGLALMIRKACDALGTASLRLMVVRWTQAVEAAWRDVEDDYALCFDWDFVPGWIIDHVDWSSPMMPAILSRGGGRDAGAAAEWPSAEQELLP